VRAGPVSVPLSYQRDSIIEGEHPYEDHINVVWADSVVNEPFDDTEFGLAKLGLRRGDYLRDGRNDTLSKIDE
jgi:hypothetical protein